jgi:hypothetical protein
VAELEAKLQSYRHRREPPDIVPLPPPVAREPRRAWSVAVAAAAGGLAIGGILLLEHAAGRPRWQALRLSGTAALAGRALERGRLQPGEGLETGDDGRVRLSEPGVGEVEVGPRSRVRLVESVSGRQRLALDAGQISAAVWAPPQVFQVDTPASTAVDLGCRFTLEVLPDGGERLRVEAGWVALVRDGREAFVPGGAWVETAAGAWLGTPLWLAAPEEVRRGVAAIDGSTAGSDARAPALAALLAAARPADALTLWHLLSRVSSAERRLVSARLAELAPPPAEVVLEGVAAGDPAMLDAWWGALGLGSADWWRGWRLAYPASSSIPKRSGR